MATETQVTLKIDSSSLFDALRHEVGEWRLDDHAFDPAVDEMHMSYDSGGSGRVAVTIVFELDEAQMARVLQRADRAR